MKSKNKYTIVSVIYKTVDGGGELVSPLFIKRVSGSSDRVQTELFEVAQENHNAYPDYSNNREWKSCLYEDNKHIWFDYFDGNGTFMRFHFYACLECIA